MSKCPGLGHSNLMGVTPCTYGSASVNIGQATAHAIAAQPRTFEAPIYTAPTQFSSSISTGVSTTPHTSLPNHDALGAFFKPGERILDPNTKLP